MADVGLTHIALPVTNLDTSIAFYQRYAGLRVAHRRADPTTNLGVVWLTDGRRPFVIVLIEGAVHVPLTAPSHLGIACATRAEVDRLAAQAKAEGCWRDGPTDWGPPVGYWAYLADPDGHAVELSYGQDVEVAVHKLAGASG